MKKIIYQIYLFAVSALIFACVLAVEKGFDLIQLLGTIPGLIFLSLMLLSTLMAMYFSESKEKKKEKPEVKQEKLIFEKFEIDKEMVEKHLKELVAKEEGEKYQITLELEEKAVNVNIALKEMKDTKVSDLVDQLKEKMEKELEEKLGLKEKFKMNFHIVEDKEKS